MSSTILPQAGKLLGGSIGGPIGSIIGQTLGKNLGKELDKELFKKNFGPMVGHRLGEITTQTANYGGSIPIIFGTVKLAGNIIWASKIKEHRDDYYQRQSKFSGRSLFASKFSCSVSLAIAIAEGEISEILRVWANDRLIDPKNSNYRFYNGSEKQMPDPLIESHCGYKKTTAFRGISYVVIEDLSLSEFGNHIPNFLFEVKVKKNVLCEEISLEERIKAMVIIPGSGEFVYDTLVQSKVPKNYNPEYGNFNSQKLKINQNNRDNKADSLISLEQLADTCPNLQWVAPVVGWFVNSTDAGQANISPGVEYRSSETLPSQWKVAGYNRESAHLISKNKGGGSIYGGTSNDDSILRYLEELKKYNYKIMFYPMIFVDKHNKPWRGRITGNAKAIKKFFYSKEGYNNFILHYANLVKDKVDAFIIGSELIGLTKIIDENNKFPAVEALIALAKQVKAIMGKSVKISYAADWSEYHHTENGWYNLDSLWASEDIDFIGIDAYFPLTNSKKYISNEEDIINGWKSGEGYDYYYNDIQKTQKKTLQPDYAWKNIYHWWSNEHINPDSSKTLWRPKSKKIWFTEIGFPSVDLACNQPNVFYSPDSIESKFPIHSKGQVDFFSQRIALSASEKFWRDSEFVEHMFIWAWDARPYPFWPDLAKIWSDGGCWSRGHWLNGKLGLTMLKTVIQDISLRIGLDLDKLNVNGLNDFIDGLVITNQDSAKNIINLLKTVYFFDHYESDGVLSFVKKDSSRIIKINESELLISEKNNPTNLSIRKISPYNLSKSIALYYFNYLADYELSVEFINNDNYFATQVTNLHIPIVITPEKAKNISQVALKEQWYGQFIYDFDLPPSYISLKVNDIIELHRNSQEIILMKVVNNNIKAKKINQIQAITISKDIYNRREKYFSKKENILFCDEHFDPGYTELICLRLPKLPYEDNRYGIYLGVIGGDKHWRGAEVLCPDNNIINFSISLTYGVVVENFEEEILLCLFNGELFSKQEKDLQRCANLAVIDEEVIQFKNAEFIGNNRYRLSGLKRCLFGSKESLGRKFILIDSSLKKFHLNEEQKNKKQEFLVTSTGHSFNQTRTFEFI